MADITLHKNIFKQFQKMPVNVQRKFTEILEKFKKNPEDPALHMHPLKESMLDEKVRGINFPASYRGIIIKPDRGDNYLLVYVDKHDAAYNWAKNKRFDVHQKTGLFQIYDMENVKGKSLEIQKENKTENYILDIFSDDELFTAGIPRQLIPSIRAIRSDEELESLIQYLPDDCKSILYGLSAGLTIEETIEEVLGRENHVDEPESAGDFRNLHNHELLLIDDEMNFKQILQASLEEWRIYLHPYQKKIVQKDSSLILITGAAGTGKTVCLLHRAMYLIEKDLARGIVPKILLLNYTNNLSITLKHQIMRLNSEKGQYVEVSSLHNLAKIIAANHSWHGKILNSEEKRELWQEIYSEEIDCPLNREELISEYDDIIEINGFDSEEKYLTAIRSGKKPLKRTQRRKVWQVLKLFIEQLKKKNIMTANSLIHEARLMVEKSHFRDFSHILVDEIQDFHPEAIRLVMALYETSQVKEKTITLAGDGRQRLYHNHFPLSRVGLQVRGRSHRLKINYRTSQEIRRYADCILDGSNLDDLNEKSLNGKGDHSLFKGPEPIIKKCKDTKEEAINIVSFVEEILQKNYKTYEICICPYKEEVVNELSKKNISHYELQAKEADPGEEQTGVRLGSMKRIKGLEFKVLVMACADPEEAMNNLSSAATLARCERYVAATRAREILYITLNHRR